MPNLLGGRREHRSPGDERLDPPRWRVPVPRRSGLLRGAAVVALLCLAALALLDNGQATSRNAIPAKPPVPATSGVAAPPGAVGFPLRLPDAGVVAVVQPGQRVDVLSASGQGGVVAEDVLVLRSSRDADGALLYLGVSRAQANRLAALVSETRLTVTVRSP
jgi:hypothetical protein